MKRFLLFAGQCYYASGGMNDFKGDFESVQDAEIKFSELEKGDYLMEWFHVYDTELRKVVSQSEEEPYGSILVRFRSAGKNVNY